MSALWSPEQREWLQAMGLSVWRLASPEDEAGAAQNARVAAAALLAAERPYDAPPRRAAPDTRSASPSSSLDRLSAAIARAARRRGWDAELSALLPEPARLRGDAAGKRALWPRLRALRRVQGAA